MSAHNRAFSDFGFILFPISRDGAPDSITSSVGFENHQNTVLYDSDPSTRMYLSISLVAVTLYSTLHVSSAQATTPTPELSINPIYTFPENHATENLAIRANGQILITTALPLSEVYLVDPSSVLPANLITRFSGLTSSLGITELEPDVFYVAAGNVSISNTPTSGPPGGVPGTFSIYEVDMRLFQMSSNGAIATPATVRKVADVPNAQLLNGVASMGITGVPSNNVILAADTVAGMVWNINVASGAVAVAASDASMQGINGMKVQNGFLYYDSDAHSTWYRIPINTNGFVPSGSTAQVLSTGLVNGDDFALDARGRAFLGGQGENAVFLVDPAGQGTQRVLAHLANSSADAFAGPSAVQFGRRASDSSSIYVTANGMHNEMIVGKAGVFRLDVGGL